jgi:hypothetical protein
MDFTTMASGEEGMKCPNSRVEGLLSSLVFLQLLPRSVSEQLVLIAYWVLF